MADINLDTILRLKRLPELLDGNEALLNKIGLTYATLVKERTQSGRDVEESAFTPYSSGYARTRELLGLPVQPVNLTRREITGEGMIASITHQIDADLNTVTAYISNPQLSQIGYYHAVSGAGKSRIVRRWWGLSERHKQKILQVLKTDIDKLLETKL